MPDSNLVTENSSLRTPSPAKPLFFLQPFMQAGQEHLKAVMDLLSGNAAPSNDKYGVITRNRTCYFMPCRIINKNGHIACVSRQSLYQKYSPRIFKICNHGKQLKAAGSGRADKPVFRENISVSPPGVRLSYGPELTQIPRKSCLCTDYALSPEFPE